VRADGTDRRAALSRLRSAVLIAALAFSFAFASGCGTVIRFGRRPDTAKLETVLTIGRSSQADVLDALGEPRNHGTAMLPGQDSPRDLWCYYYEEGTLTDDRRIFLFVFFKESVYDGYMWFSSLPRPP
jgi:hypothetical protein